MKQALSLFWKGGRGRKILEPRRATRVLAKSKDHLLFLERVRVAQHLLLSTGALALVSLVFETK